MEQEKTILKEKLRKEGKNDHQIRDEIMMNMR